MSEDWKLVTADQMTLEEYACGVKAGDILRLRSDLHIRDSHGQPTDKIQPAGEKNVVLFGNRDEPDVIWLERPDGEQHTWDLSILDTFELTGERDPRFVD